MQLITLKDIQTKHQELTTLIDQFADQATPAIPAVPTSFHLIETLIELQPGELYAGIIVSDNGTDYQHVVLLPGEAADVDWDDAKQWAAKQGGELPTRREQSLLFANLKQHFQERWYWSSEAHESDGSYAWDQYFVSGLQYDSRKSYEGHARAVRRFTA